MHIIIYHRKLFRFFSSIIVLNCIEFHEFMFLLCQCRFFIHFTTVFCLTVFHRVLLNPGSSFTTFTMTKPAALCAKVRVSCINCINSNTLSFFISHSLSRYSLLTHTHTRTHTHAHTRTHTHTHAHTQTHPFK